MANDEFPSFKNVESNTTVFVTKHQKGFAVSLRDDDCMEFLPAVKIFPELHKAIQYANSMSSPLIPKSA